MRVNDIAAARAHHPRQRKRSAQDEDRIEVGNVEADELRARRGDFVFEPPAVRHDDRAVARSAEDAYEIDRARVRGASMQRRRDDEHGQRPRKGDDLAGWSGVLTGYVGIRPRVERTARGCSRIHSIDLMLRALPPSPESAGTAMSPSPKPV